jgi:hypothetical protein
VTPPLGRRALLRLAAAALAWAAGSGPPRRARAQRSSAAEFEAYVDARRAIAHSDPALSAALASPATDAAAHADRIGQVLAGTRTDIGTFLQWHAWVQDNPVLRARVEERLALARAGRGTVIRRRSSPRSGAPGGETPRGAPGPPPLGAPGPPPVGAGGRPPAGAGGRPP